jgi:hypothetical protein
VEFIVFLEGTEANDGIHIYVYENHDSNVKYRLEASENRVEDYLQLWKCLHQLQNPECERFHEADKWG